MIRRKQVIMTLAATAAILIVVLLHIMLSNNIGPVQNSVEQKISIADMSIYDAYNKT